MSGVVALNSRRPLSISVQFSELSDRAVFPAKTEEHRTGARGKKGERGRFWNRGDVANLKKVDLGGRNSRAWSDCNALRTRIVRYECAENILPNAAATKSVSQRG